MDKKDNKYSGQSSVNIKKDSHITVDVQLNPHNPIVEPKVSDPGSSVDSTIPDPVLPSRPSNNLWFLIDAPNTLTGRKQHMAVWTGSEMIIWGGIDANSSLLNIGGIYNSASGTWRTTAITNAPIGRTDHTAIWTGSKMLIWGGSNIHNGGPLNDGGVYDPADNSWTTITPLNVQITTADHTTVWTGTKMIVWVGETGNNTAWTYNPETNSWSAITTTNAPAPRYNHTVVWTGASMIIWGGFDNDSYLNTGGIYVP